MSRQKRIVIEIDEKGNCSVDGNGFHGPECSKFIEEITKSLGERTSAQNKPEYRSKSRIRSRGREKTTE